MPGNSSTNFSSQEQETVLHVLLGFNAKNTNVIRSYENKGFLIISFDSSKINILGPLIEQPWLKYCSWRSLGNFEGSGDPLIVVRYKCFYFFEGGAGK